MTLYTQATKLSKLISKFSSFHHLLNLYMDWIRSKLSPQKVNLTWMHIIIPAKVHYFRSKWSCKSLLRSLIGKYMKKFSQIVNI